MARPDDDTRVRDAQARLDQMRHEATFTGGIGELLNR